MFLYENDETCVQSWSFDPTYGMKVHKKDTADIPIYKRIYILGTTQGSRVSQVWSYRSVTEEEAMSLFYDNTFLLDGEDEIKENF